MDVQKKYLDGFRIGFILYERLQKDPGQLSLRSRGYILSKTVLVLPGIAKINGF